jgi:secreted PhoX family phosphatase
VVVGGPLQALVASAVGADPPERFRSLGPVADLRDGKVRLHLPPGFRYQSFDDTDGPAVPLPDGTPALPGRHDGMAAFPGPDGNVWLVRNHELNGSALGGAFGPGEPYDSSALGGTTTVLVTPFGEVLDAFTSLNGTQMNCSGGPMPWGSWMSCEETVNGPDVFDDFTRGSAPPTTYIQNARLQQRHGFVYEVPAGGQSDREPITAAGRFAHEAAAYSPDEGIVYLTEDNFGFPSGLYRYIPLTNPVVAGRLENGGRLQMLRVVGHDNLDLAVQQQAGTTYAVDWVDIDDPAPTFDPIVTNDDAIVYVGNQGRQQGAAYFSRLEGASFVKGEIYFVATQGGGPAEAGLGPIADGYGNGSGQVWSYRPRTQTLTCRYQAPQPHDEFVDLDLPDNITARNDRGSIVICEDGPVNNFVRGLTRGGQLFDVALNRLHRNTPVPGSDPPEFLPRYNEEFAGATFSPSGDTLFVNIQASQGITFAIWGPWGRIGV